MADRVGQQLGHYRLLRKLGQGSFAEVYLGEHLYLERPAAIKLLHVQMERETQEQFRLEARTIAHLQHPHIVQVHDFGLDEQTPYLVMEYTSGGTLHARHPKGTPLPLEQIVAYVKQIASALDYAHQQRVIHRDIKPANLLLNARGEVVLSDFGLAVVQHTLESLSPQGPAGTPLYMAPEQIRHHPCAASDQYALGVMVYQWLCGEPPFRGALYDVLFQHLSQPPPSLCLRLPHLPLTVEEAVFRVLAKEPGQRFATMQDFALALEEACCVSQPVAVRGSADLLSAEQDASPDSTRLPPPRKGNGEPLLPPRPALHRHSISTMSKPTLAQSNRERFLRRVRAFWIEGVLDHSLHGAALIALGFQDQRDALANPWHLVFHHPETAPRPFPVGTAITEVYDAANGELLMLGAPGAGKTTLLLELARHLLDRAEQDEQQPMPVVFTLSSWASRQQPLAEWMIEELISKYQVPRQLARTWVETDQILPLLDGLDEVAVEHRTRCIEAINTYQQEHAFLPLVVSSRSADYLAQSARVKLTSAVTIQPLTQQQVDEYLTQAGEPLWALRVALHQDAALRELAETPLMLSILTLTYHGMPVEELLRGGVAPTRQQVFERYVKQALPRRGGKTQYKPEQTMKWLTWLAQQMRQHNQTMFFIEQMQPDWLPRGNQSDWFSLQRITRCISRIIIGLLSGGVIGVLLGLISGLLSGLVSAVLSGSGTLFENSHSSVFGNLVLPFVWSLVLVNEIFSVLIAVVIVGIVGGLASALKKEIHPVEVVTWSWKGIQQWRYWLIGMLVGGLIFGLLSAQSIGMVQANEPDTHMYSLPLISKLIIGLSGGLLGGLVGGLLGGVSRTTLDVHTRVRPNQGVWRSLQYSTLFGGLSGAVVVLISVPLEAWILGQLVLQQYSDTGHSLNSPYLAVSHIFVLISGLLIALSLGLIYGGVACLQHLNLRLLLWFTKRIPRNYPRFLDYAAEHILLRKVGGGYIFVHRLLLEYFASLETTATPDAVRARKEQGELVS